MYNLYSKILKRLLKFYPQELRGHALRRVHSLAGLICGMMRTKKSHLSALGQGLPRVMKAYSQEKAAKRFLCNKWTDFELHYLPYIQSLLSGLVKKQEVHQLYFVIDGSKMGKDHMALMISVVYGKRSIPVLWLVEKKPKGHFEVAKHLELLQDLLGLIKNLLPRELPLTLLGDGEFDSIELQRFCRNAGWDYALRTACDTVLYEQEERFQPKDLQVDPQTQMLFIPDVDFSEKRLKNVNFLLWHDPKYETPLPLISNLTHPIDIAQAYDRRYAIEALFKDLKSTSFNLHHTRIKDAQTISNLIMVAAFAFSLLLNLGIRYKDDPIREYVHRVRPDQVVCSTFFFAILLLEFFANREIDYEFPDEFPNNSS